MAKISGPGELWNVVASCTSIFGTRHVASPLTCVRNFVSTAQYGLRKSVYW